MKKRVFLTILIIFLFTGCYHNEPAILNESANSFHSPPRKTHYHKKIATQRPYFVHGKWYRPILAHRGQVFTGIASWYGPSFHGRITASGETYNMYKYTAAHKVLPIGTIVRVINLNNNKSVIVRINDRGPFIKDRIIDLSYIAGKTIGIDKTGTAPVKLIVLYVPSYARKKIFTPSSTLNNCYSKRKISNPITYKRVVKKRVKKEITHFKGNIIKNAKFVKNEFKKKRNIVKENIENMNSTRDQNIIPIEGVVEQEILVPEVEKMELVKKQKKRVEKEVATIPKNLKEISSNLSGPSAKIQVGAFELLKGALRTKNRYKNFRTFIKKEDGVYRVYIGPFKTREEAENFKERHHIHGFVKTR